FERLRGKAESGGHAILLRWKTRVRRDDGTLSTRTEVASRRSLRRRHRSAPSPHRTGERGCGEGFRQSTDVTAASRAAAPGARCTRATPTAAARTIRISRYRTPTTHRRGT